MSGKMIKYIALLRGVNVGGKNKIVMAELKAAFLRSGFENVITYINSGNIIFNSDQALFTVKAVCENLIEANFGMKITVGLITADDLIEALSRAPDWWNHDPDSKHNAIFVIPPATAAEVVAAVGETKPEFERVADRGNVIFWSAPIRTFSRTRWSKIVENKAVYHRITIRNANTTLRMATLATES